MFANKGIYAITLTNLQTCEKLRADLVQEIAEQGEFTETDLRGRLTNIICQGLKFTFLLDVRSEVAVQVSGDVGLKLDRQQEKKIYKHITK